MVRFHLSPPQTPYLRKYEDVWNLEYKVYILKKHIEKYIEEYNIGKLDIQNLIAILISRIQLNQKKRQC